MGYLPTAKEIRFDDEKKIPLSFAGLFFYASLAEKFRKTDGSEVEMF